MRRPIPSLMLMPAASEATPVANGFTVDASTPVPAPRKMIDDGDHAVVAQRQRQRHEQHEEAERLLPHPVGRPAEREDDHQDRDHSEPLCRKRSARRPMPVWIAPVFIVTVMNAPTASTKRKICAEP